MKIYWKPKFRGYGTNEFTRMSLVQGKRFAIALNRIPEGDPWWCSPHDHGCDFFSFMLRGGYTEELYNDPHNTLENPEIKKRRLFSGHIMRNSQAHRVQSASRSTLTLFISWNLQGRRAMVFTPDGRHLLFQDYYGKGPNGEPFEVVPEVQPS